MARPDVECDILILADSAQVAGDKFFILGGGWTELHVETLPASYPITVAAGVLIDPPRISRRCEFTLRIVDDATGHAILETAGQFEVERPQGPASAKHCRASMVLNLSPRFEGPGEYTVAFSLDGRLARETTFSVSAQKPPGPMARPAQQRAGAVGE